MTSKTPVPVLATFQSAMAKGGVRGLFAGNTVNLVKSFPEMSIRLVAFDVFRSIFAKDPHNIQMRERLLAGGLSGALSQISIYNLEVVRTRMMAAEPSSYYYKQSNSFFACAKAIIQKEGYRALFCGLLPSLMGIIPFSMIDLSMNDFLKEQAAKYYARKFQQQELIELAQQQRAGSKSEKVSTNPISLQHCNPVVLLGCGMISSLCAITVTHPLNVVRTRSQATGVSAREVFRQLVTNEGYKSLFRGYFPTVVKVLPTTSVTYLTYDTLVKWGK